jgi:hypothetical protein
MAALPDARSHPYAPRSVPVSALRSNKRNGAAGEAEAHVRLMIRCRKTGLPVFTGIKMRRTAAFRHPETALRTKS